MNTKAYGGQMLQEKHLCIVGYKIYLPKGFRVIGNWKIQYGNSHGFIPIRAREGSIQTKGGTDDF